MSDRDIKPDNVLLDGDLEAIKKHAREWGDAHITDLVAEVERLRDQHEASLMRGQARFYQCIAGERLLARAEKAEAALRVIAEAGEEAGEGLLRLVSRCQAIATNALREDGR